METINVSARGDENKIAGNPLYVQERIGKMRDVYFRPPTN